MVISVVYDIIILLFYVRRLFMKKSAFFAILSILPSYTLADTLPDGKPHYHKLESSIVTATKVQTTIDEAAGNVSVVSKKDIELRPNAKFSDTLRGIEGIRQSKSRGMDTFDTLTIRGIANGAAIMLDGVILNDMNNNTKMIVAMNPADLEQVEVIRGPFSNLYGSGAIGGAINFVTSMPKEFSTNGFIGYGNGFDNDTAPRNTVRGYVSVGDALLDKRLRLKASYGFARSGGYAADSAWVYPDDTLLNNGVSGGIPSSNTSGTPITIIGDMGRQSYHTHDVRLRAEYDITPNATIDVGGSFNNYTYDHLDQRSFLRDSNGNVVWGNNSNTSSTGNRPMPMYAARGIGKEYYNQSIAYIGYKQYFNEALLSVKYSRIDGFDTFHNPDGGANASSESSADTSVFGGQGTRTFTRSGIDNLDIFTSLPFNIPYTLEHNILLGIQTRHIATSISDSNIANWKDFSSPSLGTRAQRAANSLNVGGFIEWRSVWLKGFSTSLGLRYDYWLGYGYESISNGIGANTPTDNNHKSQFSPKASLNYQFTSTSLLKLSFGQGFRAPNMSQLIANYKYSDGTQVLGNPSLRPESVTSFDIGIEQKIQAHYEGLIKAYYFHTYLEDIIYRDTANQSYLNGGLALINGLELSYRQNLPLSFGLLFTYTFTNSQMLKNPANTATIGKKLTGIPTHLAYGQIYYDDSRFFGSFGVEYMSKPFAREDNSDTISGVYGATDSYILADVRLGMRFAKHYELSVNATNIFNYKYYSYYRAPGAAFYVQFGAKL